MARPGIKVTIFGTEYGSTLAAARALGVSPSGIKLHLSEDGTLDPEWAEKMQQRNRRRKGLPATPEQEIVSRLELRMSEELNKVKPMPQWTEDDIKITHVPELNRREIEGSIEELLVKLVKRAGGEIRKVSWVGRRDAPDRFVLLPGGCFWVELKSPSAIGLFPANAHERAQEREHKRLRAFGQKVYVVGSAKVCHTLIELYGKRGE